MLSRCVLHKLPYCPLACLHMTMVLSPPRVCLRQVCDHNYGGFTNDVVRFGLCLVAWGVVSQFASLGRVSFRMSVTEVPTFVLDSMSTSACYRS